MKLKEWRKKRKLSQEAVAKGLEERAREIHGAAAKKVCQTTVGYWERGTMPHKYWRPIIVEYTKGQVTAVDLLLTEGAGVAQ